MKRSIRSAWTAAGTAAAWLIAAGAGGCAAQSDAEVPSWFAARLAEHRDQGGYPSLQDVPTGSTATTDQRHWNSVEAEVEAAGRTMEANPRNTPVTADDAAEFDRRAREAIEATRASR